MKLPRAVEKDTKRIPEVMLRADETVHAVSFHRLH